jgi:hypothetical protein
MGQSSIGPSVNLALVNILKGQRSVLHLPLEPRGKLNKQHSKSYRLRLVSISCDPNYIFSIDSHPLTVIEVDGVNVQSVAVDSLQIFAGM